MTRQLSPCGTRAAEARHRRDGVWPCRVCVFVRDDVYEQARRPAGNNLARRFGHLLTFGLFTDAERVDIAREVARTGVPVEQFALICGLRYPDAQVMHAALTLGQRPRPAPEGDRHV